MSRITILGNVMGPAGKDGVDGLNGLNGTGVIEITEDVQIPDEDSEQDSAQKLNEITTPGLYKLSDSSKNAYLMWVDCTADGILQTIMYVNYGDNEMRLIQRLYANSEWSLLRTGKIDKKYHHIVKLTNTQPFYDADSMYITLQIDTFKDTLIMDDILSFIPVYAFGVVGCSGIVKVGDNEYPVLSVSKGSNNDFLYIKYLKQGTLVEGSMQTVDFTLEYNSIEI